VVSKRGAQTVSLLQTKVTFYGVYQRNLYVANGVICGCPFEFNIITDILAC